MDIFQLVKGVKLFHDRLQKPLLQTLPSPLPQGIFSFHHYPDTFTLHISFQAFSQNKLKQPFIFLWNIVVRILPETTESPAISIAQRIALPISCHRGFLVNFTKSDSFHNVIASLVRVQQQGKLGTKIEKAAFFSRGASSLDFNNGFVPKTPERLCKGIREAGSIESSLDTVKYKMAFPSSSCPPNIISDEP